VLFWFVTPLTFQRAGGSDKPPVETEAPQLQPISGTNELGALLFLAKG